MTRVLTAAVMTFAATLNAAAARAPADAAREALAAVHPGTRVEILDLAPMQPGQALSGAETASVLQAQGRGEARLMVRGPAGSAEYRVRYAAWVPGLVAIRRIGPGEALSSELTRQQELNVAEGLAHEMRGILLPATEDLSRLEARQTLLEGGFVTSTAVRRIPDLRRGDAVRIDVISGDVRLSSQATALEPASVSQRVRVQTLKTRRELVGVLRDGGVVEVRL